MSGLGAAVDDGILGPTLSAKTEAALNDKLDGFLYTPGGAAQMILNGSTSPRTDTGDCGDEWMFGINYLSRALRRSEPNTSNDMTIAVLLGQNFSMQCPDTLPDSAHTFARPNGGAAWPPTTKAGPDPSSPSRTPNCQ